MNGSSILLWGFVATIVLVVQFGSFLDPIAILISLPLSLIGVMLALPVVLHQIWKFIEPGLYNHEKRFIHFLLPLSAVLTVQGQRAHSARPWQGSNAIFKALPLLERMRTRKRREVRVGSLSYFEVIVPTQVWTENSRNVVPDRAMINVNVRFAPGRSIAEAEADLYEIVRSDAEIEVIDRAPSGAVYLDHPLVEPWRQRLAISIACKQAWTDVARFTERGIPAVNFGPGETAQAHQAGEWCSIESLDYVYRALRAYFSSPEAA